MKKKPTRQKAQAVHQRLKAQREKREAKEAAQAAAPAPEKRKPGRPRKDAAAPVEKIDGTISIELPADCTFDFHPYCELLPRMMSDELEALLEDIRLHGQREAGVTLDGKILDGRNRYICCQKLNRPFSFRAFDPAKDGTPLSYIISKATHRNMDDTQKACAAVGIQDELAKDADARMKAGKKINPKELLPKGQSRDQAGSLFGVSGRYVSEARFLREKAPNLFLDCFNGFLPLTRAKREYLRQTKKADLTQKAKTAASSAKGDDWQVIIGDSAVELLHLDATPRLIFADPPYNLGFKYGQGVNDSMSEKDYANWCESWLGPCADKLAQDGSLFLMIDARHQSWFAQTLSALGLHWRNTIIWHETFGNYTDANFTPCARYVHYFTKHPSRFTWNGGDILIESARQQQGDPRANPAGKVPGNVWEIPRLVDNAPERMPGGPTQVPLALMDRIIRVASDPGDLVLDPFSGTGSTGHAALLAGRRYLGIERVKENADWSKARLSAAAHEVQKVRKVS